MYGEAGIITLARIKRENVHVVCISVVDSIKINEQNKSIGIGPLYLQNKFDYSYLKLWRIWTR